MTRSAPLGLVIAVVAFSACGTAGVGLDEPAEPTVTLFPDETESTGASATAEPDIPEKMSEATTLT